MDIKKDLYSTLQFIDTGQSKNIMRTTAVARIHANAQPHLRRHSKA